MNEGMAAEIDALGQALGGELRHALRLHKRVVEKLRERFRQEETALRREAPDLLALHMAEHRSCVMALFNMRELMKAGAAPDLVRAALAGARSQLEAHDERLRRGVRSSPGG